MTELPAVSVIIPTANGRDWRQAATSALHQRGVEVEVILVNNGQTSIANDPGLKGLKVIESPPSLGANGARQAGITAARNELVALLDDDDEWLPDKLRRQLHFVGASVGGNLSACHWVCGSGKYISEDGSAEQLSPKSFPGRIDDVAEYLFMRRTLTRSLNQLQSSTLLFPRSTAVAVPFDPSLRLHQDWNWILDVEDQTAATIIICPEYLVRYNKGVGSGITKNTRALESAAWAEKRLASKTPRIKGDFALTVPFNMALEAGSYLEAVGILRNSLQKHRPGLPAVARAILALIREPFSRPVHRLSGVLGATK